MMKDRVLSANPFPGGCWPTPVQELLLQAALLREPAQADEAFTEWFRQTEAEDLDEGQFRLLPLTVHNLRSLGIEHPFIGRMQGIHRKMWVETRRMFHDVQPAVERLVNAGIPVMLTKGAPLAHTVYPDLGRRPMRDLDLLLPEERFQEAVGVLQPVGWKPLTWMPAGMPKEYFSYRHGVAFRDAAEREIDIHWHLLFWACSRAADEQFWKAAQPFDFYGLPVVRPCAADQLLQLCVHGMEWNEIPPIRWVADAVMLLRGAEAVDWKRLHHLAIQFRLLVPLRTGLRYLAEQFQAPVCAKTLAEIEAEPVTAAELREFELYTKPFPSTPGIGHLVKRAMNRWDRARLGSERGLSGLTPLRFLQYQYRFDSLKQLGGHLASYPFRRLSGGKGTAVHSE